ncbi:MAG: glycosyltransferase [Pirellulaceae bacterium]|jgi:glycosyltransferase involved in cell wall biosynthesis|nr:glycosyl transferase [Planctomycetaceae bacterium]MDP6469105.1 glycosyltransferase [Pirellulaceae bacterium]MDP6555541.1 glycosyltransferase [Pirellulaceae bacterium]
MSDLFFYLGLTNLLMCLVVAVPLVLGMRSIGVLSFFEPSAGPQPQVSAIVAARNEERNIEEALSSLLAQDYRHLEIIVVNDRSTDRTGEIVERLSGGDDRLRVIHLSELPAGWIGKNYALNAGAAKAQGELLLFTDADAVMQPDVIRRAVSYLRDNQVDHLPMLFRVRMPNWLLESFVVTFFIYLLTYCRPWKCPNPHSTAHIGIGGFNLIRAEVYQAIGTHEALRMRPDDDLKLGKLVKKHGFRQVFLNAADMMYVPWYASVRELVLGLEKNAFSGVDYNLAFALVASGSMLAFNVLPFVAVFLTSGVTWYIYLVVVVILLAMGVVSAYHVRARMSCCLAFPLGAAMFVFIQWRTIIVNMTSGGIRWRDTHYPLSELKANKI